MNGFILNPEIFMFLNQFEDRLGLEHTFDSVQKEFEANGGTWDIPARRMVGKVFREVYQQMFPDRNIKDYLYVEGDKGSNKRLNKIKLFGSDGIYPDMGILKPQRIAIELDHGKGSNFKVALGKSSFDVSSGCWDYCVNFFYSKDKKVHFNGEKEGKILGIFANIFNTYPIFFD